MHATDEGASAVEYALILAAICAILVVIVYTLGDVTSKQYDNTCQTWADASGDPCN